MPWGRFEDDHWYETSDSALRVIATQGTLAVWRHQGKGPPYQLHGRRVYYRGKDLNDYMDKLPRIVPAGAGIPCPVGGGGMTATLTVR